MIDFVTCFFFSKALIIFTLTDSGPLVLGDYEFPAWSHVLGTLISVSSLLGIIGWAIYEFVLAKFYHTKVSEFY